MLITDVRASSNTGIAGACSWSCVQEITFTALIFGAVSSARGFSITEYRRIGWSVKS